MLERYASNHDAASALWKDYGQDLKIQDRIKVCKNIGNMMFLKMVKKILPEMRKLYKSRIDLQKAFPDPFKN